jgi:hypothetical protein
MKVKSLIEKFKNPTNKRTIFGSKVAKVGAGITVAGVGLGGSVEFFEPNMLELLNPSQLFWVLMFDKALIFAGLIVSAIGVKIVDEVKE